MKKYIGLSVFIFLAGIIAGSFLLSCNITIQDEILLAKPTCEPNSSNIIITLARNSVDTEYINIYRQDTLIPDAPIYNIGIIFPKSYGEDSKTYIFSDSLIFKDHTYKYYARYFDGKEYLNTNWSNEVKASDGLPTDTAISYLINNAFVTYNENEYTLTFHNEISNPTIPDFEQNFKPSIIFKTEKSTQIFELESIANGKTIFIKSIIPPIFYDTPIELVGLCGQKTERINPEDGESAIKRIVWTMPSKIQIEDNSSNTISIPSTTGINGYDYSRKIAK